MARLAVDHNFDAIRNYAAFGYNTGTVPKGSVPRSYADLLKPEWKGNIGMESKAYEWFGTMLKAMGEEKGLAYMRQLAKQTQLRSGRTLIAQLVEGGLNRGGRSVGVECRELVHGNRASAREQRGLKQLR